MMGIVAHKIGKQWKIQKLKVENKLIEPKSAVDGFSGYLKAMFDIGLINSDEQNMFLCEFCKEVM